MRSNIIKANNTATLFTRLLNSLDTIPAQEKSEIERQLHMYDQLWEESPRIKQERAKSRAEGELRAAQTMIGNSVSARYPGLTELAKQPAAQATSPITLNILARKDVSSEENDGGR